MGGLEPSSLIEVYAYVNEYDTLATFCVHTNGQICVVFNRNCFPKMKDYSRLGALRAVTYTTNCGNRPIKEMVQNRHVVTTHH